jgi:hypothetical protein
VSCENAINIDGKKSGFEFLLSFSQTKNGFLFLSNLLHASKNLGETKKKPKLPF